MNIKQNFNKYFFFCALAILIFVVSIFSFNRFIIKQDYFVGYEGVCNPVASANKCFLGCSDDACTEKYFYSKIVKYAPDLRKECGEDITDCDSANVCFPNDYNCSITYCDPEIDGESCATEADIENNEDVAEESL